MTTRFLESELTFEIQLAFLLCETMWADSNSQLTKAANHMWQMWKLARFES